MTRDRSSIIIRSVEVQDPALAEVSEAEYEVFLEDFSKDFEHFPPLPPDFSRADMYTNHGEIPSRHAGPPLSTFSRLY